MPRVCCLKASTLLRGAADPLRLRLRNALVREVGRLCDVDSGALVLCRHLGEVLKGLGVGVGVLHTWGWRPGRYVGERRRMSRRAGEATSMAASLKMEANGEMSNRIVLWRGSEVTPDDCAGRTC